MFFNNYKNFKLVNCGVCETQVSDTAHTCPKCGHERIKKGRSNAANLFIFIYLLSFVFGAFMTINSGGGIRLDRAIEMWAYISIVFGIPAILANQK